MQSELDRGGTEHTQSTSAFNPTHTNSPSCGEKYSQQCPAKEKFTLPAAEITSWPAGPRAREPELREQHGAEDRTPGSPWNRPSGDPNKPSAAAIYLYWFITDEETRN